MSSNGQISGRYRTIVADPPWEQDWHGGVGGRRRNRTDDKYSKMTLAEILTVGREIPLARDATLYLWVTQDVLHSGDGQRIAVGWGFPHRVGEVIWRKPNFGTGAFPRIGHETCLIYRRGRGSLVGNVRRDFHSVQTWKQTYENNSGKTHSAKPDGFYDAVLEAHLAPFLELFSRKARFHWHTWGDQALHGTEMVA